MQQSDSSHGQIDDTRLAGARLAGARLADARLDGPALARVLEARAHQTHAPFRLWSTAVTFALLTGIFALALALITNPAYSDVHDDYFTRFDLVEDADDHVDLARWCRDNGLHERAEVHLAAALRRDPDHGDARRLAGYHEYRGAIAELRRKRWLDDEELAATRLAEAALASRRRERANERAADPFLAGVDRVLARVANDTYLADRRLVPSEDFRPFLLLIEEGKPLHFEQIGKRMQDLLAYFDGTFGEIFDLPAIDDPLVIIAWRDRAGYAAYCEHVEGLRPPRGRAAHYNPRRREIVVHGWPSVRRNPFRPVIDSGILAHEGTHQLMHSYTTLMSGNPDASCRVHWFQEGIAEFCGNVRTTGASRTTRSARRVVGEPAAQRVAELRHALATGTPACFSLEELLSIRDADELHAFARNRSPERWQELVSLFYAQAWSFVHFLERRSDERRSDARSWQRFVEVMRLELAGNSDVVDARRALGIQDIEALEEEWIRWFRDSF